MALSIRKFQRLIARSEFIGLVVALDAACLIENLDVMADTNGNESAPDESWFVPNFSEGFKGTRMQQGFDAEFRAVASGNPKPKVEWTKDGNVLGSTEKHILSYEVETGRISLVIKELGPGDEGTYSCTVFNAYGKTTATLSVNPDGQKENQKALSCYGSGTMRGTLQRNTLSKKMQTPGSNAVSPSPITGSPEIKGL